MFREDYRYCGNELKRVMVITYTKWARWSKEEKDLLAKSYDQKTMAELSKMFGRPIKSIEAQLTRIGVFKYPNWSKQDEQYLLDNYTRLTPEQLSLILKKSKNAIRIKKHRICIK